MSVSARGPFLVTNGFWLRQMVFLLMCHVTGKQTYPGKAEHIDHLELPVSNDDLRNCVRQRQEAAAVISSRENLPDSNFQPESGFDWEGQSLSVAARRFRARHFSSDRGKNPLLFMSFPLDRCQVRGPWKRPRNHCVRHLLTGSIAPSQNCHIPLSVLLAI